LKETGIPNITLSGAFISSIFIPGVLPMIDSIKEDKVLSSTGICVGRNVGNPNINILS
jgi:hypothetical protein